MNNTFLYTLPQWFIFAAIFVTVYGWIENKKPFRIVGALIFLVLGIFSALMLSGDFFAANTFLTPEEIAHEELEEEVINEVPFQAKLLPAYWSFIVASALALPALILDIRNNNKYRWFIVITGFVALAGFFIIIGAIKSL